MGNFEKETKLSKNASRKGQAFSSAIQVAEFDYATEVEEIGDIERNGYTFSDGCGLIKMSTCKQIASEKFDSLHTYAFQIRMGGWKGVLVACRDGFESDSPVKVKIRKSMKKFDHQPSDKKVELEVIRLATYSCGYLNKQIIGILWSNGIDAKIFLDMQEEYTKKILLFWDIDKFKVTEEYPFMLFSSIKFIDTKLYEAHKNNLNYFSDPFIGPLIKLVCYNKLKELRKRFRVFDEKCWVLIGVFDPYEWLEEGEVYIKRKVHKGRARGKGLKPDYISTPPLEGPVLVSRNPCVHNGDVRRLTAVVKKELEEYWNIIVFSSKGNRPAQDQMACGDLDGDIYWINWREEFLDNFNEQPPNGADKGLTKMLEETKVEVPKVDKHWVNFLDTK